MIDTVLTVDIGTTSLKAGLVTADGEVVFICRKKYSDSLSITVAKQWEVAFNSAFDAASAFARKKGYEIKGIGISGNGPTIVSENGVTYLWNGKNGADVELSDDEKTALGKIRSLFMPRILMFKHLYEKEFEESKYIFSGPEYLIYKLTGQAITILPEARYESAYWNNEVLSDFGLNPENFPKFVPTASFCGNWKDLPVYAGGPDFIVALIGTNTLEAGKICDRSGSSEGINYCVNRPIFESGIRTLPSVIPDLWNCSVLIPDSSKLSKENRIKKLIEAIKLLKKISGKYHLDFPTEMKVTGGQTKNHFWMKEKSLFLKMNLLVCSCSDSELLGDASVAWFGLGKYKSLQEAAENIVRIKKEYKALGVLTH